MSGIERVLEIAASTRVLRERRLRALAEAPGAALLGREFLNLRGLAERCAAETGVVVRRRLDGGAISRLVAVCAQRSARFGPLVVERPGFAPALAGTLRDLRDAGVAPDALPNEVADLRALYTDVDRALLALEGEGAFDRIGLFRLAVRGAPAWVARRAFARAEVHGATELVGSAGDLVDAIARALPPGALRFLQPDWGSEHAERLRAGWPWTSFTPEPVELVEVPALDRDGAIPEGALSVLTARTPREELERVARRVLALLERGVAPREILIVARSLEPYRAWLPPIFDGYGIPVTSSLGCPAVSEPEARAWLDLVHALARDLERGPLLRLIDALGSRGVARLAERTAREGAVVRGEDDWFAALDAAERSPELHELRRLVDRFATARREFAAARSFGDAARIALALGRALPGEACRAALEGVAALDQVDRIARTAVLTGTAVLNSTTERPAAPELAAALESALVALRTPWHEEDDGGVRILDAIQARGLPCAHLFLIGMVHGAWPRDAGDDPFLSDPVREALRNREHRPVPLRGWALAEERLLLGLLLAQTRERVVISLPVADGAGRALAPSGLLRDLPFAARGTDVLALAPTPHGDDPQFARAPSPLFADSETVLAAGRDLVARTEALTAETLPFDGAVGPEALRLPAALPPSFVDQLGRCPQRAFFASVLRARELEDRSPDALEPTEAGTLVHEALRQIYQTLFDEGALRAGTDPEVARARAASLTPNALASAASRLRSRVKTRQPAVWDAYLELVAVALDDFLRRDLASLLPAGVTELEGERTVAATVAIGADLRLAIEGRIDRIVRGTDATLRVGDFKTARDFAKPVSPARVRSGTSLQIPLYALAVAAERETEAVIGEALPVPLRPERDRADLREAERSIPLDAIQKNALPVLTELVRLLAAGDFPFRHDDEECRFCPYTLACRHEQTESRARVTAAPALRGWFALRGDGS